VRTPADDTCARADRDRRVRHGHAYTHERRQTYRTCNRHTGCFPHGHGRALSNAGTLSNVYAGAVLDADAAGAAGSRQFAGSRAL
jgi:hypothetical protein